MSAAETALSRWASAKTISGLLPPSSSVTCFSVSAACAITLAPGADLAGERHLRHAGVTGERLADPGVALHHVEHARRHARFEVDLRQSRRGEGGELGRLEHHRVAAGERRRRLPARDLDRVVPRADPGADAQRLPSGVAPRRTEIDVRAVDRCGDAGEVLDAVGAREHVDGDRLGDRLAGVGDLELGELLVAGPQQAHCLGQHPAALGPGERPPCLETGAGGAHRGVDIGVRRLLHLPDDGPGGRIHVGNVSPDVAST